MIKKTVTRGEFTIDISDNGHVDVTRVFANTKDILRKISDEMGFYYENTWNTQTLGSKLVDYLTKYKVLIDKCFNVNNERQIYDIANIIALQIEAKYGFRLEKSYSLVLFSSWFETVKNKKNIENLNLKEIAESVFRQIDNHEIM